MRRSGQGAEKPVRAPALSQGEDGFMLLGLIVAMAIILLVLGVAASKVAFSLRREREVESARRADQYVRAIRKFYLKNQHYPGSLEQLENTNNIRYLRKRYVDPLTGKDDYRLIIVGQNKTTVKGFFGAPLAGLPTVGTSPASAGGGFGATSASGASAGLGMGAAPGGAAPGGAGSTPGAAGSTSGAAGAAGATNGPGSTLGSAASLVSTMPGTAVGPFMGVGSSATGASILIVNEQTTYETWEFLYDPRLEKLRLAGQMNAGGSSVGANSLGTTPGTPGSTTASPGGSGTGSTPPSTTPAPQP